MSKVFGIQIGGSSKSAKSDGSKKSLSSSLRTAAGSIARYEVVIIILLIGGLLTVSALRMLHYANPDTDQARLQENSTKLKKISIDPKTVERIKQLTDSQTQPTTQFDNQRNNPFSE